MVGSCEFGNKLFSFAKGGQLLHSQAMVLVLPLAMSLPDILFMVFNFTNMLPPHMLTLRHL